MNVQMLSVCVCVCVCACACGCVRVCFVCRYNDYILARIDSDGNVLIETNQGVGMCK